MAVSFLQQCCRIFQSPRIRELMLLYLATFVLLLPFVCVNLKHSWYFRGWRDEQDAIEKLTKANSERLVKARQYLQELPRHSTKPWLSNSRTGTIQVVISVITHARTRYFPTGTNPGYLTQTVAKFLEILEQESYSVEFRMFVCNVDPDPTFHKEAADFSGQVTLVNRFIERHLPMVHPKEKEKQDYQFCLNTSLSYGTDYVFMVEDDSFPHDDTLSVLENILSTHETSHKQQMSKCRTSYIKFYHPERLLSYVSLSPERIPELISFSAILSTLATLLYTKRHKHQSRSTDHIQAAAMCIWVSFFIYFSLIALSIGRTNLLSLRRLFSPYLYYLTPAPSCCTQALLYPRTSALSLLRHLHSATCGNTYAKDHVIEQFSQSEGLSALLVQPSTFTHIGLYSAVRNQIVNPFLL